MDERATLIRCFRPELEVRTQGSKREIEGIAVPYNKVQRIHAGLYEQFDRGAFNHQLPAMHRVKASREHLDLGGDLIGRTIHMEDTSEGLFWRARISKTLKGDETLELVRDGSLTDLSVGFNARKNRTFYDDGHAVTSRVKADLFEVALTVEGAYGELAMVAGVRTLRRPWELAEGEAAEVHEDSEDGTAEWEERERRAAEQAELFVELRNVLHRIDRTLQ